MGFPGGSSDKESARQCSRCKRIWSLIGKIPWRSAWQSMPGESMDRGTRWAINHRVAQSRTRLKRLSTHSCDAFYFCGVSSNFSFFFMILWICIFSLFCQWDWLKIYWFFSHLFKELAFSENKTKENRLRVRQWRRQAEYGLPIPVYTLLCKCFLLSFLSVFKSLKNFVFCVAISRAPSIT